MKTKLLHIPVLLLSLLFCIEAYSQDVVKYTLNEVIKIAQEQSPDAQMAQHRYRRSYWSYRTFKATYLPGVILNATLPNLNRSINAIASQDGSTIFTPQSLLSYSASLSVNQKLGFSGGEVFLGTGAFAGEN